MNAFAMMVWTELGISMLVNPVQFPNRYVPSPFMLLERVTDVSPEQYLNAALPIVVTELGMTRL